MCVWYLIALLASGAGLDHVQAGEAAEGAVENFSPDTSNSANPSANFPRNPSGPGMGPSFPGQGFHPGGRPPFWGFAFPPNGFDKGVRSLPQAEGLEPQIQNLGPFIGGAPFFGPPPLMAVVQLMGNEPPAERSEAGVSGLLTLQQLGPGAPGPGGSVLVTGNVTGLPAGTYELFVHRSGDMRQGCNSLGTMLQAFMGFPGDQYFSELGLVVAASNGLTQVRAVSPAARAALTGPMSVLGRAIVIRRLPELPRPGFGFGVGGGVGLPAPSTTDEISAKQVVNAPPAPAACGIIAVV